MLIGAPTAGAAGTLDHSFGNDGRVLTGVAEGSYDQGLGVAIQADGKVIAVGASDAAGQNDFAVVRHNSDGSLDPSFDGDGKLLTDFLGGNGPDIAQRVAIQSDGKIVVVGSTSADDGSGGGGFALARYNPDGSLDQSFDGDGKVVTDLGDGDGATGIAIQSDGKIIAAGSSSVTDGDGRADFALARYNPDGSLDQSFDGDGKLLTDFGGVDVALGVALGVDGKVVVSGYSGEPGLFDFGLARYNADGSLDQSFDGDGKLLTDFGKSDGAVDVAIQSDGRIVAAGSSGTLSEPADFALARYNPDGTLDPSFDNDGTLHTDFLGGSGDNANAIVIQANGNIIVGGGADDHVGTIVFALARYDADGRLDRGFGGDGRVVTDFGGSETAFDLAIQPDGKLVAAGFTSSGGGDFALARYLLGKRRR